MISAPLWAHSRAISGNMPSWQMISAIFAPFGPSTTGMPILPGSQGSVIELDLAMIVDDQARIIRIAVGVELHDGETAPDMVVDAGLLERRDRRPIEPAHDLGIGVHGRGVQRVCRK